MQRLYNYSATGCRAWWVTLHATGWNYQQRHRAPTWPQNKHGTALIVQTLTRKATQPNKVPNDAHAKPPHLSLGSCDLDLWPTDPQSWLFHAFVCALLVLTGIKIGSLSKRCIQKFGNRQTKRQISWGNNASAGQSGLVKASKHHYSRILLAAILFFS